jgi:hypothetical protein
MLNDDPELEREMAGQSEGNDRGRQEGGKHGITGTDSGILLFDA